VRARGEFVRLTEASHGLIESGVMIWPDSLRICGECQADVDRGWGFCPDCGFELARSDDVCRCGSVESDHPPVGRRPGPIPGFCPGFVPTLRTLRERQ